jgi:Zn-finger nucleic acid-binding protein
VSRDDAPFENGTGASGEPALVCPACGAELPSAFPGASIACVCGHRVEVVGAQPRPSGWQGMAAYGARGAPGAPPSSGGRGAPSSGGPYRSAVPSHDATASLSCPFCGNECAACVRICPHCDVRLENVRCQRCFSLQAPGTFACTRCRHALELEPLLDATDAPCPRCRSALDVTPGDDRRTHECARCGGLFVARDALAEILSAAEIGGAVEAYGGTMPAAGRVPGIDEVRYLACPLCHSSMNRVNFGKVSGVIVDVCKLHGTWFDAGELTRVVAFAAGGGLERTRAREKQEQSDARDAKRHANELNAHFSIHASRQEDLGDRAEMWSDFLRSIFRW